MSQTRRVLSILRELPRGHAGLDSTAPALARRHSTSVRSIYRDIALLEELGFAISSDADGYYLLPTDQALPARLCESELLCLLYASQWVKGAIPTALQRDFDAALAKLAAARGSSDARRAASDDGRGIAVLPPLTDGPAAARHLLVALRARIEGCQLRGVYSSPDHDEAVARVLHPYAVVYRGHAHYLVAFCELRREVRTFRLDRFTRLEIIEAPASIPPEFDVERHFSGAWEVTSGRRRRIELVLRGGLARRYASTCLHPSQRVLERCSDMLTLEFRVAITDELRSWLLGLGPEAEVAQPQSLRREIGKMAARTAANYSKQ